MSAARRLRRGATRAMVGLALAAPLLGALVVWLNVRGEMPLPPETPLTSPPSADVARGAYLVKAGNCIGCHTTPGGAALAGGRPIETPFGAVFAPNLTPDDDTGLGRWTASEFWRAMHHGRSRNGRLLYPAFPYTSFTQMTRQDVDAVYAYLRSVPAVKQPPRAHALRFPYSTQPALAVWRALYFRAGHFSTVEEQSDAWNRGKYLVEGLGHCAACHASRNALGAARLHAGLGGGLMTDGGWYAPALSDPAEAGVQQWPRAQVVQLLKTGVSPTASVSGPMADVVHDSTQHLDEADLDAMAQYLISLPPVAASTPTEAAPATPEAMLRGAEVYAQACAACHGKQGEGVAGIYPALAGNRAVTWPSPHNLVQMVRHGGFAPTTEGNPRPFGMPPFAQTLSNDDVAAVVTYLRQSWGHRASAVSALQVSRIR
ncbi:c-type cytochrome [Ideonella sp. DXS29W]|uniref:C-type cytochrome n=1 Tax=Ideonella lacteola TaxID=2984193 RepID=A0ABU9C264_9BURK